MVFGHTLDLTLDDRLRDAPLVDACTGPFRGLTAPLFLVVAGWALVGLAPVGRRRHRGAPPPPGGAGARRSGTACTGRGSPPPRPWPPRARSGRTSSPSTPCPASAGASWAESCSSALLPRPVGRVGAMGTLALWVPFMAPLSWTIGSGCRLALAWRARPSRGALPPRPLGGVLLPRRDALDAAPSPDRARRHRAMALLLAGGLLLAAARADRSRDVGARLALARVLPDGAGDARARAAHGGAGVAHARPRRPGPELARDLRRPSGPALRLGGRPGARELLGPSSPSPGHSVSPPWSSPRPWRWPAGCPRRSAGWRRTWRSRWQQQTYAPEA